MIEIRYTTPQTLCIKNADKNEITFSFATDRVEMWDFDVSYPGEYEKSGNLLEVKEYENTLFYKFLVDTKHICIVPKENFELKEEILEFFGDVDVLLIKGSKASFKTFENIEAKMVIPYGEEKDLFLTAGGQHPETVQVVKVGAELDGDRTDFINLEA